MKMPTPFAAGEQDKRINPAIQRPIVNIHEAENLGEELAGETRRNLEPVRLSKHGAFGPRTVTHPGLEE